MVVCHLETFTAEASERELVVCHLQTEQGSLGEIVKMDHHKKNFVTLDNHTIDVNFNNSSFGYAVTVEGGFAVLRGCANLHLGSPLRCE